jgi:hypothetical protein
MKQHHCSGSRFLEVSTTQASVPTPVSSYFCEAVSDRTTGQEHASCMVFYHNAERNQTLIHSKSDSQIRQEGRKNVVMNMSTTCKTDNIPLAAS